MLSRNFYDFISDIDRINFLSLSLEKSCYFFVCDLSGQVRLRENLIPNLNFLDRFLPFFG